MSSIDPYATHMEYLAQFASGVAVEFGCGDYSTRVLLERCDTVISIEMTNPEWLTKVRGVVDRHVTIDARNWKAVEAIGAWQFLGVEYPGMIDFALVDGHKGSRFGCVNFMMRLNVPIIIMAHDTEAKGYRWDLINPVGYRSFTYRDLTPWTTVWVREDLLIDVEFLRKHQAYVRP